MTHAARLTQKRLEGEILKLLEGESARLFANGAQNCLFCKKYGSIVKVSYDFHKVTDCSRCPVFIGLGCICDEDNLLKNIHDRMVSMIWEPREKDNAIPGALAIHLWLFEL
jgi:hypothetical protein